MKTLLFTLLITSAAFSQIEPKIDNAEVQKLKNEISELKKEIENLRKKYVDDVVFLINKNDTLIKKIWADEWADRASYDLKRQHIGYKIIDEKRKVIGMRRIPGAREKWEKERKKPNMKTIQFYEEYETFYYYDYFICPENIFISDSNCSRFKHPTTEKNLLKRFESEGKIIIRDRRTFIDEYLKKDLRISYDREYSFIVQEGNKFILMTARESTFEYE